MHREDTFNPSDRWIFVGFLILIAWMPLPWGSKYQWSWSVMEIWVYLLAIAWLLLFIFDRVRITVAFIKAMPVLLLLALWLLWVTFQVVPLPAGVIEYISPQAHANYGAVPGESPTWMTLSVDVYATRQGLLKSIAYVLVFCLALLLLHGHRRLQLCAGVLILSGVFQAAYGSLMTLSGMEYGFLTEKKTAIGYASGTFTNRNHLAGYLEMCLATGIGIMIASLDRTNHHDTLRRFILRWLKVIFSSKTRLRLYLVIMVIALVLTHSRMGNTAFFTSLIIAGGIGLIFSRRATRGMIILITSLILIDVLIVGTWFGIEKVAKRLEETSFAVEGRDEVYEYVTRQWQDYPWTGSGLGSFYAVFPKYRKHDVAGYYNHAHNDYLEIGAETGIIGFGLLGLVVVLTLIVAVLVQHRRHDPLMRGLSFAALMGITAILIHSTVDFNLQIPANAVTFMLLLAFAWIAFGMNSNHRLRHNETTIGK